MYCVQYVVMSVALTNVERLDSADLVELVDTLCEQFLAPAQRKDDSLKDIFKAIAIVIEADNEEDLLERWASREKEGVNVV